MTHIEETKNSKWNWTRKISSTFIFRVSSLSAKLVISRTYSFIPRTQLNFIMESSTISLPPRDLSADWNWSSTALKYYFAFFIWGNNDLMLFIIHIRINIMLNLFNLSHDLNKACCFGFLVSIIATSWSICSAKSRSKILR